MTMSQVISAMAGFYDKESERVKTLNRITWEATRWQTWVLWNLQVSKKWKIHNPQKLMHFEWDEKPKPVDRKYMKMLFDKFPDKLKN
jgi:hypothetical protein